jgi:hypothetical protein
MCYNRRKSKENNGRLLTVNTDIALSISPLPLIVLPRSIVLFTKMLLVSYHYSLPPGKDSHCGLVGSE